MQKLVAYRLIKSSSDKTFKEEDINSVQGAGWIIPTEVGIDTLYFEGDITFAYIVYQNRHSEYCISRQP